EALEAIVLLLRSDEPVTYKTDWFELRDAGLNLRPYSRDFEIAVAAMVSPAGPRAAARHGRGPLSSGATPATGLGRPGLHWGIMEESGHASRDDWRLVGPMHIAETREQAARDVEFGLQHWVDYFQKVAALPIAPETGDHERLVDAINSSGFAVIGTPDD